MLAIQMLVIFTLAILKLAKPMLAICMWASLMLVIPRLTIHMLAILMLVIFMLAILMLTIPKLVIHMLVVPSLQKSNKFEVLLFTNALGRHANVQRHKNSELNKIQRKVPLFMVSPKKLKTSSWCIHSTKNCQKRIRNEKVMAPQSVHGQKVEKVPHPTLGNHSENTQTVRVCCSTAFKFKDEL